MNDGQPDGSFTEMRIDPFLGTVVHLVRSRQHRPNQPSSACPFCVGGLESPEPYDVRSFPNRWPSLGEGRCEVVLYTSDHDATFASLGVGRAQRVIDLWAERTRALRDAGDVAFVLIFENRGVEVGATISHPHGQIYAFDHVPARPLRRAQAGWRPDPDPGERLVLEFAGWRVVAQGAPVFPVALSVAPTSRVPDLPSMPEVLRRGLAEVLVDLFGRLDRLFERPLPYMMWINQVPTPGHPAAAGTAAADGHWIELEIVSPWRAAGVQRYIAAAEVACEEYFNPVSPEEIAERLRRLGARE